MERTVGLGNSAKFERLEERLLLSATELVSKGAGGLRGNAGSEFPALSGDGRYVAYSSYATNLVSGDTNARADIFVRDRRAGTTKRVSLKTGGGQGDGDSSRPDISDDGRFVVFDSAATNLVAGDTNGAQDIFLRDRLTGKTARVSVSSTGKQANAGCWGAAISGDGRYVAFSSAAGNLVGGDTNGKEDVFVHDRLTAKTARVSVRSDGAQGNGDSSEPALSADGRYVAFRSGAANLVAGDTNGHEDIFVHDRQLGQTQRVSLRSDAGQANADCSDPVLSADGRYVAYDSWAGNLVAGDTNGQADIFVYDRQTQKTQRVSVRSDGGQGNGYCSSPVVSADGRYVAYYSWAGNLVAGDTNGMADVFVYDRQTHTTQRASVGAAGAQGNGDSYYLDISADGTRVAFRSGADNLVPGDTNGQLDIFLRVL